jgi:glycine/D-amino acid oxidase-like deaminating enzyme
VARRAWYRIRSYTTHYHPYIGTIAPGIVAVLGGNGRGAQAADAIGNLAAQFALTGEWRSELPHAAFRVVSAPGTWHGMSLLRDHSL